MELTRNLPTRPSKEDLAAALTSATGRIAPLWPLESFVAVNPYLGLVDHPFDDAARLLSHAVGARTTLSAADYREAIERGLVEHGDLEAALAAHGRDATTVEQLLTLAEATSGLRGPQLSTYVDVASVATGRDWSRLRTDRVSGWAAAHFDRGQALWRSTDPAEGVFASWKREASLDRTPEVMGLRGFRSTVKDLPDDPVEAAVVAVDALGLAPTDLVPFIHALLLRVGGWAAYVRRLAWDGALLGEVDDAPEQFAAVLLAWELGVMRATEDPVLAAAWARAREQLAAPSEPTVADESLSLLLVLQDAYDRGAQRRFLATLASGGAATATPDTTPPPRPETQAVFCIDVRSEVLRRHLEATASGIDTIGFAGFFGLALAHLPLAHEHAVAQCPVLLAPGHTVTEALPDPASTEAAIEARQLDHHVRRAWKSFKMGAVSCFSFVGPVGLAYLPKLFTDGRGLTRPTRRPETEGLPAGAAAVAGPDLSGISLDDRVALAAGALTAMSLREGFAPLVALVGHGSSTTNNPYGTGLDCGACGGHSGDVNARVAAALLGDPAVRAGLLAQGIDIPDDTWFVPGLHDTTTDEVHLLDLASVPESHAGQVDELRRHLAEAGRRTREERARRLGLPLGSTDIAALVKGRATDWAQVRPEWGLAGCRAFVAGPRSLTRGVDLGGRAFLHSYDWHQDQGFAVLETILTAPVIVASWISLQYYASTVDNEHFGSGDKTLHNVVGRLGVLEGNGGDLRSGLPWQSVHDGQVLQHEPLRLQVLVAAPRDAIAEVVGGHDHLRALCDNGWIALYAIDDDGVVTHRYDGAQCWAPVDGSAPAAIHEAQA